MSEPNIKFPNVDGVNITISQLELYPRDTTFQDETILFNSVTIEEDMFAESIFGSIEFIDSSENLYLTNQIVLNDPVTISFNGDTFNFQITDINITSDLASKQTIGPNSRPTKIVVRFASNAFLTQNFNTTFFEDFIGKISITENDKDKEKYLPEVELPAATSAVEEFKPLLGFVQTQIAPALNKPLNANSTFNDIWLKHDPTHYPYSKIGSSLRISQIMNYICEYACDINNYNAVNFFFWEDLFSWNFRSIESLLEEQKNISDKDLPYFTPSTDENYAGAIVSMEVINAILPNKLLDGGAFVSEYVRVKPNWDSSYSSFLDTTGNLNKTRIVYNYQTDASWLKISSQPVKYFDGLSTTVRITDTVYGYYSDPYQQASTPWWNYFDNYNYYKNDESFSVQPDRSEKEFWQSQYDLCELPGDYLNIIQKKIKWRQSLVIYRQEYAEQKRLKRQWEVYKKSVCCEREQPETFFALLTKAEKIYGGNGQTISSESNDTIVADAGGVWKYEWAEVEFWPRAESAQIPAPNIDPTTGEKKSWSDYSIIEFEDNSFPFVFVLPKGYMQGITPIDPTYPDNRAYNLNEILNSRVPKEFEYPNSDGSTGAPFTLVINPGVSDSLGFTGPRSDKASITSYPSGFKMMPIGKFRLIKGPCPPSWNQYGTNSSDDFYQAGRVVQMFRIPKETLTTIRGETLPIQTVIDTEHGPDVGERDPISNLYVFDIENAHDGLCIDCQ